MAKREDIRITKSKRDLKQALRSILETTKFSKITIIEICDEAMINRMTFYKHYKDKTELLADLIHDEINYVSDLQKKAHPEVTLQNNPSKYARQILEIIIDNYANDNKAIVTNLSTDISSLTSALSTIFYRTFMKLVEDQDDITNNIIDTRLAAYYYSGGIANLLIEYVQNNWQDNKQGILDFFEDQIESFSKYFVPKKSIR